MAIARGAGTEIIRSIHLEDCSDTDRPIIYGQQHHIYTVLSVICFADGLNAAGDYVRMYLYGYDSHGGTVGQRHYIFRQDMQLNQTFVFNDKFSFNGFSPTGVSTAYDTATEHNAVADQGGAVQELRFECESDADYNILVTYVDQNNA